MCEQKWVGRLAVSRKKLQCSDSDVQSGLYTQHARSRPLSRIALRLASVRRRPALIGRYHLVEGLERMRKLGWDAWRGLSIN